jgi:hypothetical protein
MASQNILRYCRNVFIELLSTNDRGSPRHTDLPLIRPDHTENDASKTQHSVMRVCRRGNMLTGPLPSVQHTGRLMLCSVGITIEKDGTKRE